jgi:hypothetical protein
LPRSLARSFIEQQAAGYGGVEAFDVAGHGDRDAMRGGSDEAIAEAGAFVADEECAWASEWCCAYRNARARDGGNGRDVVLREQVESFCFGCVDGGNAEGGAGGSAECFGVPGAGGAWEQENAGGGEGFGRAQEGADVAGVLETGEDENERRLTAEERVWIRIWREDRCVDERGDALGLLGGDGAREDIGRQQEMFGVVGGRERRLVAVAQEDGGEAQMAAQGLGDEVLAFDGNEPGGGAAGAGEGGAQLFDARVLAALDEAGACAEGAGGHRGDFTPLSALGAVSYASRAFSSRRFNRRMRLFRDGEASRVYTYWKMFRMIACG